MTKFQILQESGDRIATSCQKGSGSQLSNQEKEKNGFANGRLTRLHGMR
jgi:hypothetical protein